MKISELDAEGRGLLARAADLRARMILLDMAESEYAGGNLKGSCVLIHAMEYLKDRISYELWPWPENCIPINWGHE